MSTQQQDRRFTHNPTIDLPTGTVARSPMAKRRPTKYDWESVRQMLEENPGLWVLALKGLSSGMFSWLRKGGPPAFDGMGGQLHMSLRNQELVDKTKKGDLWLRWTPADWTEEDQALVEASIATGEAVL